MWISRTSIVLALVAGCNWVYGLDPTITGADSDGDGIYDGVDNCPAIANADQLDTNDIDEGGDACAQCPFFIGIDLDGDLYDDGCDRCLGPGPSGEDVDDDGLDDGCDPCIAGTSRFAIDFNQNGIGDGCEVCFEPPQGDSDQDGLDDACDKCLGGPPHDEDGDGIEDGCDNCPLDPNPDQEGLPGSIGTACRRAFLNKPERALFDPFLVHDPFRWSGVSGAWTVAGDQAVLEGPGERRVTYRLTGEFRILLHARLVLPTSHIEIRIETPLKVDTCSVSANALDYAGQSMPVSPGTAPFTIEIHSSNGQAVSASSCIFAQGTTQREIQSGGYDVQSRVVLIGSGVELTGFDLVAAAPITN